ncbi:MAG: transporter related protein [Clostridiales bacterium]|jgi:molybdate transport system ATP-binding protein|nr:transporter related protein [Clostridiales bacterium]
MSLFVDIKKKFKGFTLDVEFNSEGQNLGILGASGCGKTMTLKCIAGIEKPDEGRIVLNDKVLFDSDKKINLPPQKRNVGYLFQNYALFPNMTVNQNIGIGVCRRKDKKLIVDKMRELLHLNSLGNRYPMQLSGGQQQRVALARILAYEPKVLMLDEPFSAMDSYLKDQLKEELFEILKMYQGEFLMVSHDREEIYRFCNKIAILDKGKMIITGDTKAIFNHPSCIEAARITGCKNISRASKISDFQIEAIDWSIILSTSTMVDENVKYVGIRAHDVRIATNQMVENLIEVDYVGLSEGPFEDSVIFKSTKGTNECNIWYKRVKTNGDNITQGVIPKHIFFPREKIILLR